MSTVKLNGTADRDDFRRFDGTRAAGVLHARRVRTDLAVSRRTAQRLDEE